MIQRTAYIEELRSYRDKRIIKVITGVRRCGKSTLLEMYRDALVAEGVEKRRVIYLNFEDMDNRELLDAENLFAYVKERLAADSDENAMRYVFFDEIQYVYYGFKPVFSFRRTGNYAYRKVCRGSHDAALVCGIRVRLY